MVRFKCRKKHYGDVRITQVCGLRIKKKYLYWHILSQIILVSLIYVNKNWFKMILLSFLSLYFTARNRDIIREEERLRWRM